MKYTIPTEGMSCSHCEMNVKNEVSQVKGVKSVNASAKKKIVEIEVDDGADLKKVAGAIKKAGYRPGKPEEKKKLFGLF